jgi:hypothetical protein|tara:strand:+ start:19 stop:513 length:495 start_codon:yes stop_codon:yes gene_type:complete
MINTYNLFAVPVTETTIVIQTPLLNKITNWCEENKKNTDFISVRNGFQEHGNFDGKEELDDILNTFLRLHFKQEIDHSWLNVLNKNGDNVPHVHLGDKIVSSGVFYLSRNNSAITFMRNEDIFSFYPKLFNLLVFPKKLIHQVSPHLTDELRISYSINMRSICN